jgi:hypothetical protein
MVGVQSFIIFKEHAMYCRPVSAACNIAILAIVASHAVSMVAQETSTSTNKPTSMTKSVTVDHAQVVYVSGDDVVLKDDDGRLRLLAVSSATPLIVDGKAAKPGDLTPGATLSHVQAKTSVQSEVTTVTQIDGTITQIQAPKWVTLRFMDGTSKRYEIPAHATFKVNGKDATAFELRKGMKISATAITTEGMDTHSGKSALVSQTPPPTGTLLILRGK